MGLEHPHTVTCMPNHSDLTAFQNACPNWWQRGQRSIPTPDCVAVLMQATLNNRRTRKQLLCIMTHTGLTKRWNGALAVHVTA
jgi:hypothetical protein